MTGYALVVESAATAPPEVPIGYLVGVTIAAAMTLSALVAPRLPGPLGAASFLLGLTISELPFLLAYLLLASTLLAFAQGDIGSPGGWVAVGLAVLTTVGLAVLVRRGLRAGSAVTGALDEGLGPGWRTAPAGHLPYARVLCWPFPVRPREVTRVGDISYGDAGRRNLLDVYHHRGRPAQAPVLVYFHGGGYHRGHKRREAIPLLHRLARHGWVCVSANYRLRPRATFPDHLVDAKKVIGWARTHGHRYGADPSTLVVAGSSAGGHLAVLAALTQNEPHLQPGFEDADTSMTAAISLGGYYGRYYGRDAAERIPSTPFAYPVAGAPPIFIAHGDRDTLVSVHSARQLAARLRTASGNTVVYAELPGGHHAFDLFHSLRFEAVIDGIEAFCAWVRSPVNKTTNA